MKHRAYLNKHKLIWCNRGGARVNKGRDHQKVVRLLNLEMSQLILLLI